MTRNFTKGFLLTLDLLDFTSNKILRKDIFYYYQFSMLMQLHRARNHLPRKRYHTHDGRKVYRLTNFLSRIFWPCSYLVYISNVQNELPYTGWEEGLQADQLPNSHILAKSFNTPSNNHSKRFTVIH